MSGTVRVSLIVAAADNDVIGRDNALPWHLPGDLAYFKRMTIGKPVIMGRKTFESVGRPLPGRTNIVITRNPDWRAEGVHTLPDLGAALALAEDIALTDGVDELMVLGGAEIYAAALPLADRIYLTRIHAEVDGDARLPAIDWMQWRELGRERHGADASNPYDYSFVIYERGDRK